MRSNRRFQARFTGRFQRKLYGSSDAFPRSQNVTSTDRPFKFSNGRNRLPITGKVHPPHQDRQDHHPRSENHGNRFFKPFSENPDARINPELREDTRKTDRLCSPAQRPMVVADNRRAPSLQWRSGLRESKHTTSRQKQSTVTLFVDNIPKRLDRAWFRRLFERCGVVVDLFISAKTRRYKNENFGFVRFNDLTEAEEAISVLNGYAVRGRKLWVAMAKYGKDGIPVGNRISNVEKEQMKMNGSGTGKKQDEKNYDCFRNRNTKHTFRDGRRYSDVVAGIQKQVEKKLNAIPVTHSINVREDTKIASSMKMAIIAENSEVLDIPIIRSQILACDIKVTTLCSLSPTKMLIVFECEMDAKNAVDNDSPLWNVFDDIRLWGEGEMFDDRLVWIECIGIHPLCCSKENLKLIGELWGPVLHIENKVQGIESITGARIRIRTKAQNKIDNRIRLVYDHGSCDVWVKEYYGCCTNTCADEKVSISKSKVEEGVFSQQRHLNQSPQHIISPPFEDPLVQDAMTRTMNDEVKSWVDPILSNENIYWSDNDSADCCFSRQIISPQTISPLRASKSARPRGRPKKSSDPGLIEASKTWEIAKSLGINVDDENAVLSGLRKSKRILNLEDKGE